jgi:hypothetical protein
MLPAEIIMKIEALHLTVERMRDLSAADIGHMLRHVKIGDRVRTGAPVSVPCPLGLAMPPMRMCSPCPIDHR